MAGALALAGTLDALWQFHLCLGLGVGFAASAIGQVPHAALLSRWYHGRLTTAIAGVSAAAGTGVLLFSPLVQTLIEAFGWRDAYHILGGGLAVLLLALLFLPWREIERGRNAPPFTATGRPAPPPAAAMTFRQAVRTRPDRKSTRLNSSH